MNINDGTPKPCISLKSPLPFHIFEVKQTNIIPWNYHRIFFTQRRKITEVLVSWRWVVFHLKNQVWKEVYNVANQYIRFGSFIIGVFLWFTIIITIVWFDALDHFLSTLWNNLIMTCGLGAKTALLSFGISEFLLKFYLWTEKNA